MMQCIVSDLPYCKLIFGWLHKGCVHVKMNHEMCKYHFFTLLKMVCQVNFEILWCTCTIMYLIYYGNIQINLKLI